MTFKERLTFLMAALKLDDKEISHSFHISISTIRHWLAGFSEPHPVMAKLILKVLEEEHESKISKS